uniref:RING-type domain-containing protein n=1 Tax=Lates calcarifer TaxID=8187 RepID=A0A4W6BLU7_LATCA
KPIEAYCSISDSLTLLCGHSFCRQCITDNLYTQHQCPQCRTAVPTEGTCLPTSHILKSLAEKAKEAENIKKEHGHEKAEVCWWNSVTVIHLLCV